MQERTFDQENSILLENMLDSFYYQWSADDRSESKRFKAKNDLFLELYITGSCNQRCEYCYLQKHQKDLYPPEIDKPELILNNLKIYFNYLKEKKLTKIHRIDLFSGEIWGWPLGNKVFDILLDYIENQNFKVDEILIPSNCSFVIDSKLIELVQYYIDRFKSNNCRLIYSVSFDGEILDSINRPLKINVQKNNDKYYQAIYAFAKKNTFGFHPMIAPEGIEQQIENYAIWIKRIKEYYPDNFEDQVGIVMMLEVRSDKWTKEKIISYLKWLNYIIDTDLAEYYHNDIANFKEKVFYNNFNETKEHPKIWQGSYSPYDMLPHGRNLGCSLGRMICLRLGDLAICPCHRTSYPKLILGQYEVKDNKIIGVKANNIPLANQIYIPDWNYVPKCDVCPLSNFCLKSCIGLAYETQQDVLLQVPECCNLQIAKFIFLYEKYKKIFGEDSFTKEVKNIRDQLLQEREEIKEWINISQQII